MERQIQNQFVRRAAIAALIVAFFVLLVIIVSSGGGGSSHPPQSASQSSPRVGASGASARKAYVVRQGDTLSAIAQKTGVSVSQLQTLNPNVDPQALHSGERVNIR